MLLLEILNTLILLAVAIAITGTINRTRALLSGRKGVRFFQHIYNTRLLLRKGAVYSSTGTVLSRIVPAVYLATALISMLFIPVADLYPLISFDGDLVCFIYLLALGRVALIMAAMDTGSSFEGMGASREALYGALIEPGLMLSVGTLAMVFGYTSFSDIFEAARDFNFHLTIIMILLSYLTLKIFLIESGRVPVDDPRTHLELTMIHEVMCLDYCGVDLAFINIAGWLKGASLALIAANAISITFCFKWWLTAPLAVALCGVGTGVVESFYARNKLSRNTTFIMTAVSIAALIFFLSYLLQLNIEFE